MNNEPLDLARRILAGSGGVIPADGDKASKAVIMVLPFPNAAAHPIRCNDRMNLFQILSATFQSLISQARFNPEELALANDPNVYSRFLIVPWREKQPYGSLETSGAYEVHQARYAIASGSLGGFGGFLSRTFREHDYHLGRRNCQWFLRQYFVLPSEDTPDQKRNKLFDDWTPEARTAHALRVPGRNRDDMDDSARGDQSSVFPFLPIIPLVGKSREKLHPPARPYYSPQELEWLRPKIERRLDSVIRTLIRQNVRSRIAGAVLSLAWWKNRKSAVDFIMKTIRDDLTRWRLMS
jgi:hypothetical protein